MFETRPVLQGAVVELQEGGGEHDPKELEAVPEEDSGDLLEAGEESGVHPTSWGEVEEEDDVTNRAPKRART